MKIIFLMKKMRFGMENDHSQIYQGIDSLSRNMIAVIGSVQNSTLNTQHSNYGGGHRQKVQWMKVWDNRIVEWMAKVLRWSKGW